MPALLTARDRPLVHLGLLAATGVSVFATFVFAQSVHWDATAAGQAGIFTVALLGILGSHEMGHYLLARKHQVDSSLPFFIPLPLLGVGTLGAVIRLRGKIPHRDALVDIGAAGPIAGFLVAVPVLWLGLLKSRVVPVAYDAGMHLPGHFSVYGLVKLGIEYARAHMEHRPPPANAFGSELLGDNLLMVLLTKLRFGTLGPHQEVLAHPLVEAGWFGMLVTMLNLLPVGQLDGGHLTAAVFGPRAVSLGRWVAGAILLLALAGSVSWLLWFIIATRVVGFEHPPVENPERPLSRSRLFVCWACAAMLVLCLMPVPIDVA